MRRSRTNNHLKWRRSLGLAFLVSENTYGFVFLHFQSHHPSHQILSQQHLQLPLHRTQGGTRRPRRSSTVRFYSSTPVDGNNPDFYKVLNVPRTATPAQIKQAYRTMAKKYHPDANPNYDSTLAFQQVNRAYEVLSDPQLRNRYDQYGPSSLGTSAASDARAAAAATASASTTSRSRSGSSSTSTSIPVDNPFGPNNANFHTNPWSQRTTPFQYDNFVPDAKWMDGSGVTDGAFGPAGNSFTSNNDMMRDRSFYRGGVGSSFFNENNNGVYNVGEDIHLDLDIDLETAALGGMQTIVISHLETCEACHGRGRTKSSSCPTCHGLGHIMEVKQTSYGSLQTQRPCPTCGGKMDEVLCHVCGGYGAVTKAKEVRAQVPPGVESFTRLRIRGQGHAGIKGGRPGDLYLFLHVVPHPLFTRDGTKIRCDVMVNYIDAILGATLETPIIGGEVATFQIPPGTQEGDEIILEGYGGRSLIGETGFRGQHIVTVRIDIPEDLLEEEKSTLLQLQEIRSARNENPSLFPSKTVPLPITSAEANEFSYPDAPTMEAATIRVNKFEKKYVNHEIQSDANSTMSDLEEEYRIEDIHSVVDESQNDTMETEPIPSGRDPLYSEDTAEKPYFVSSGSSEFDPLRDLLDAPVEPSAKAKQEAARRQKDIQEAEELVARELEKLKDLLYAPIASTAMASKLKAEKLKRIKEAEDLVSNEMAKLQELLNAPLESTAKATQMKLEKERRIEETNQAVKTQTEKLREFLYAPVESTERTSSTFQTGSAGAFARKNPMEQPHKKDQVPTVAASGGASSTFVSQDNSTEIPFFSSRPMQITSPGPSSTLPLDSASRSSSFETSEVNGSSSIDGTVNGFGASSQLNQGVSSSSGLGEGVSISVDGARESRSSGSKGDSDDKDIPGGPQVASQALSASVVADKRSEASKTRNTKPQSIPVSGQGSTIVDVTARSILEDGNCGGGEPRKPAPARRTKHGKPSTATSPSSNVDESSAENSVAMEEEVSLDDAGPTMDRRRGYSDDADTRFDIPKKRNIFEDVLFSVFKV